MNEWIEEELRIIGFQPLMFLADAKSGELYCAVVDKYNLENSGKSAYAASIFYNLGRVHGIRAERKRRKPKIKKTVIKQVNRIAEELILELSKNTPEDYQELKLMMLAAVKHEKVKSFLQKVFFLTEERRPKLIEMKVLEVEK